MTNCKATTKAGRPCPNAAMDGGYCYMHSPTKGKERAQARKKGGERRRVPHGDGVPPKSVRSIPDALALLDYALAETIPLENSIVRGRLLVALAGAYIEALKVGELEARLAAIEAALKIGDPK